MTATLYQGDALEVLRALPSESVQCVVTSPPYFRLRSYLPHDHPEKAREMGSEATPAEFVANLVSVFDEVKRVLRRDGVCWLNIADSYSAGGRGGHGAKQQSNAGALGIGSLSVVGVPPKNLLLIPQRLIIALQDAGWWVRSECVWAKPNAMPQSATDRPTNAHEMVYLLTKSARYFYDAEAVRTPAKSSAVFPAPTSRDQGDGGHGAFHRNGREKRDKQRGHGRTHAGFNARWDAMSRDEQQAMGANLRSVWTIPTQGFSGAHYATFPEALVDLCIRAGTSERGACPECGAPWRRVVERESFNRTELPKDHPHYRPGYYTRKAGGDDTYANGGGQRISESRTTGWEPSCACDAGSPKPCLVLDPFMGSGTTAVVALRRGCDAIGIDLDERNIDMARKRITEDAPLLNCVEEVAR